MWLTYVCAVLVCLAFVYLPGYLFFFGIGLSRLRALVTAPVASVASYCVLGIVFTQLGIFCSWAVIVIPTCALCAIPYVVRSVRLRTGDDATHIARKGDWATLGMYLGVGLLVGIYMLLIPLGRPDAFLQGYDNAFHMEVVRSFVDSGKWSVLHVSKYLAAQDMAISPLGGHGFYPALWHVICALVVSASGCAIPIAINAVNFVVASVLFPSGMMLLLSRMFESRRLVRFGSLCTLAFVGFPWFILYWGPLYPNTFGFALAPLVASMFMRIVDAVIRRNLKASYVFSFLLGTFVLVVAQTSSVFFCVIALTPYCVYRLWTLGHKVSFGSFEMSERVCAVSFVIFVLLVWTACVFAPPLHELVFSTEWAPSLQPDVAIEYVLKLRFAWLEPQTLLAALVLIGAVYSLFHREYLWVTIAYLVFCLIYVLCVSTDGFLKHFLGGFWYTDYNRIPACLAMVGVALAALALEQIYEALEAFPRGDSKIMRSLRVIVMCVICAMLYLPAIHVGGNAEETALGKVRDEYAGSSLNELNGPNILLDADEEAFLKKVADTVPEGELVINMPDDGSIFAYPLTGMRTYYRDYRTYDGSFFSGSYVRTGETQESKMIRKYGAWIASSPSVLEAFQELGARYVLILDQGDAFSEQGKVPTYQPTAWTGLASIMDDTPGFEAVLSEGDMRLYEITALDENE